MKKPFNISEFFQIKKRIQECDAFYAALYNLTDVVYSEEIPTACITFDKEGRTLEMQINPSFWSGLNEDAKAFVILHELYHVVFDHGKRIIALGGDFDIGNKASDIVINHHINDKVGIHREGFEWKTYCWVETCFPDETEVPTNRNFEFYYNKLSKQTKSPDVMLLGSHGNGEKNTEENEQKEGPPSKPSAEEFSPEHFSEAFKEILKDNPELSETINQSPDFEKLKDELKEHIPPRAKLGNGNQGAKADFVKSNEKPTFKKLMKILVPKKKEKNDEDLDVWVGTHRRYSAFLKQNKNILLPNVMQEEIFGGKNKKEVWIFMDSSGSCRGMFQTFSNIVMALLKEKEVNCRAFTFGDDCEEINVKDHQVSFYSGNDGGFDCIEEKILKIMKKEKIQYPDNVVVLSDGGVHFNLQEELEQPKNWVLLINNDHCKYLTPPGGKYFKVDKHFFGLDKQNSNGNKPRI